MAGKTKKNIFLSPLFAPIFILSTTAIYYIICFIFALRFGYFDIEEVGATEILTYLFYGFGLGVAASCYNDFINTDKKYTYYAVIFLWICALFRETGAQYWLTTHDTVVTKTRFFLNPNNPLHEKLVAGTIFLIILAVAAWLFIKYFKKFISELLKFNPISWTIVSLVVLAILTQMADRIPAGYFKTNGVDLAMPVLFILKIFEEGGESLLPLLIAIAFGQYHFKKKEEN